MFYGGIDPLYLWIFIATLLISTAAQVYIRMAYGKWSKVKNHANLTGSAIGERIARIANLSRVTFETVPGAMTDHYDPRSHTVRISQKNAEKDSVAAMAIVAHELGHAEQHAQGSALIGARNLLLPALKVSPQIAYFLIFIGLFFNITGAFFLGILFYCVVVLFSILTLPVEIDASRRGLKLLKQSRLLTYKGDEKGAKNVLTAAATTYIAATITAILQLLYYLSIARRRN